MFLPCFLAMVIESSAPVPATQPAMASDVSVTAVAVFDRRSRVLPDASTKLRPLSGDLAVVLRINGDSVANATRYGRQVIQEAVDDTGKLLASLDHVNPRMDDMKEIDVVTGGTYFGPGPLRWKENRGGLVEILLSSPSRKATSIRRLKGTLEVRAQGSATSVSLPGLQDMVGTRVEDATLKAAGIEITVLGPQEAPQDEKAFESMRRTIHLKVSGSFANLAYITVLDPAGAEAGRNTRSSLGERQEIRTFVLSRPLDNTLRLKVEVFPNQKTLIVPFDLKDIELP